MGIASGNPTWQGKPSTATPVTAGRLNAIEDALDAHEAEKLDRGELVINVKDHGAVGDNIADDSPAFAAALAALPAAGGILYIPSGIYKMGSPVTLRGSATIMGARGAILASAAGDIFSVPAGVLVSDLHMSGVDLRCGGSGFNVAGSISQSFIQARIWQQTGTQPAVKAAGLVGTAWDLELTGTAGASEPLVKCIPGVDQVINCNTFRGWSTHSSSYVFHLEEPLGSGYVSNNRIHDFTFELPTAGAVRILSGFANTIDNVGIYDLPGAATDHLIYLGKSATSALKTQFTRVAGYFRAGGSLAAGVYDIKCESGNALATTVENSGAAGPQLAVDWGSNSGSFVSAHAGVNGANVAGVNVFGVRQSSEARGNWWGAADVGAGFQFWDTTSNKLLTSDGTNWRDALGTIV